MHKPSAGQASSYRVTNLSLISPTVPTEFNSAHNFTYIRIPLNLNFGTVSIHFDLKSFLFKASSSFAFFLKVSQFTLLLQCTHITAGKHSIFSFFSLTTDLGDVAESYCFGRLD